MELLAPSHCVFAADSYGAGKSPDWHSAREISLSDEVSFLAPVFAAAGDPFSLVGHSYGGAIGLIAAAANPNRIKAMALFEPTLFSLVEARGASADAAAGIKNALAASAKAIDDGDPDTAARHFIDYWMGNGSWHAIPTQRKPTIAESMLNIRRWGHALLTDQTPATAFASLDFPILYMLGESSPQSAHAIAEVLIPQLPKVKVVRFAGIGHMGPVTHPNVVNSEIAKFIREV